VAAGQASLREHNLSIVLREVLDKPGRTTRAKIAYAVGLTRASVSGLVEQLIRGGLVTETDPEVVDRAGRPGVRLVPAGHTIVGLGLEVQGDQLSVRAVDLTGRALSDSSVVGDFRGAPPGETLARLVGLASGIIEDLRQRELTLAGVCLSVPGIVQGTIVRFAPNLGWVDVDVQPALAQLGLDGSIVVANDADLAGLAETRARRLATGSPQRDQSFFFVAGEVGIGGAVVIGGVPYVGLHGWSAEVGHVCIDQFGPPCGCGSNGCLEVYAGKHAIMAAAGLSIHEPITALVDAAETDPAAAAAIDSAATALGLALSAALNMTDVDTIVLGGNYHYLYDRMHQRVLDIIRRRVLSARWATFTVERALTTEHASLTGAALRVLENVVSNPAAWVPSD
jgi:predicted NBD/HSP70 family sugar kinase